MDQKAYPLLCIFCAAMFAQPPGHGVISGTVVEASSGDPVRKAIVTVTWQGSPRSWATTRTDGSGRFIVEGLPPGKYAVAANKPGLGTANYGANSVRELGDFITLGDGETRANLKLRFLRSGSVSGHVFDPDGDPVAGATVSLLRGGRQRGEHVLLNYRGASTNDRGEYRITALDPGEYYARCTPNRQNFQQLPPAEIVVPQYYGGALDSKDAVPLTLRGDEVLAGIDFHLTAERPAKITGRVTGVPPMETAPPEVPTRVQFVGGGGTRMTRRFPPGGQFVNVEIGPTGDGTQFWNMGTGAQGPDFHFEFPENVPGRYRVRARVNAKDNLYYASQIVDAREGTTDIVLAMNPAVTIKGHLKIEGPGKHPLEGYTLSLSEASPRRESYAAPVQKDGSFTISQVPPGEWVLNINPNPQGLFENSVRLGDKDYTFKLIEIPPGSDAPLNVVLSSSHATVEGEIDGGGADAKRAGILVEPVGKLHTLTRFYYTALADDSGKFKLNAIAPGKYRLYALEKIATNSFRNPESADLLDAAVKDLGEDLDLTEGAKVQIHPKLVPEEKAREILKP